MCLPGREKVRESHLSQPEGRVGNVRENTAKELTSTLKLKRKGMIYSRKKMSILSKGNISMSKETE